jgi:GNAT superfamily N-acetyltransferase
MRPTRHGGRRYPQAARRNALPGVVAGLRGSGMATLRWAPPTRDDDATWAGLLSAIETVDERGETYELADLQDEWASVWAHPETDAVFVWEGRELVAFGWLKTQVGSTKVHRIACWGGVHPSHRARGIGRELLHWQLQRASDVAATLEPALDTQIALDAGDHQRDLLALATRAGFAPVRTFLELARPTGVPLAEVDPPLGLDLVQWHEELDEGARHAHRESFVDHWGSEPRSVEEWRQWYTGYRSFRPDLSLLAVDPASAEVVSFVLTAAYPQDWATGPVEAWINSVGTRRAWRGKGVAQWLLTETLRRVATSETGFERSMLGVDAENPTGALRLYRRLGFEDCRVTRTLVRAPLPVS